MLPNEDSKYLQTPPRANEGCLTSVTPEAQVKSSWHSMLAILGPVLYSEYHKLICGYVAGKITREKYYSAVNSVISSHPSAKATHNKIIEGFLAYYDSCEQKALLEMQRQYEAPMIIDEVVPRVEPLRPADVHNRFLTMEEKREIRDTEHKMGALAPETFLKPIDLNMQYFNYPIHLVNLQTLPTMEYLKKRLAVYAASKGLRLTDDDDASENPFPLHQREGTSKMDCGLSIWAKITASRSHNYFL